MPDPTVVSPFYTMQETCAYLRLDVKTVRGLARRGLLKSSKALRRHRFLKTDVQSFHERTS